MKITHYTLIVISCMVQVTVFSDQEVLFADINAKSTNANKQWVSKEQKKNQTTRSSLEQASYIRQLQQRAEEHYFQKRYNIALRLFLFIIKKDPENLLAYRYSGDVFLLQSKLKQAEEQFTIARELSPRAEEEWFRLAQVYILSEQGPKAYLALQKALALKPDMYLCHFYLGIVYFKFYKNKQKVIEHWEIYKKHSSQEERKKIERTLKLLRINLETSSKVLRLRAFC